MAFVTKLSLILFSLTLFTSPVMAQESEISDADMELFATAFQDVQAVNQQIQNKMVGAIQKEGLDIQTFNKIQQASQSEEAETEISEEDMAKYQKSIQAIQVVQQEAQQKMKKAVEDSGLGMDKYQNIMRKVQEDPEIQAKLQEMFDD